MRWIFQNHSQNNDEQVLTGHQLRFRRMSCLAVMLTLAWSGSVQADGDAERGKQLSVTCAACHGADGNSVNPEWPSLAGQHTDYLVNALTDYREGVRQNVLMSSQAMNLDDQQIADLAAFYSAQTASKRTADPALVDQGSRLYRGGDLERGISACSACHGQTGRGIPGAGYPKLAGQHAKYTANQLLAYRAGERTSDADQGQIMRNIADRMEDADIEAVAAYIQGLQ